ncbi:MAG: hypothetical protein EOM50_03740 [Erysipelotrichia bacterium]|nr:hypothetical protein [Erysipelotrichia bacterium]
MKTKGIYTFIILLLFLLLASFIKDTGSAMVVLILLMPMSIMLIIFLYGSIEGFDYMLPLLTMFVFLVIVYGFFNTSALVYVLPYGLLSLVTNFAGALLKRFIIEKRK